MDKAPKEKQSAVHQKSYKDMARRRAFQPYHATCVPKEANLGCGGLKSLVEDSVTTLMLRNIPNKYTQAGLLQEIDSHGFAGTYDFFYLPMDTQNHSNVGYAFINFVEPASARVCYSTFSNYKFQKYHSRKICAVSPAHLQGFEQNVKHFENRAVTNARNNQYRPVVFPGGAQSSVQIELEKELTKSVEKQPTETLKLEKALREEPFLMRDLPSCQPPPGLEDQQQPFAHLKEVMPDWSEEDFHPPDTWLKEIDAFEKALVQVQTAKNQTWSTNGYPDSPHLEPQKIVPMSLSGLLQERNITHVGLAPHFDVEADFMPWKIESSSPADSPLDSPLGSDPEYIVPKKLSKQSKRKPPGLSLEKAAIGRSFTPNDNTPRTHALLGVCFGPAGDHNY